MIQGPESPVVNSFRSFEAGPDNQRTVGPIKPGLIGENDPQKHVPDTPWDCHICPSIGVVLEVNVGIYGIHGVSGCWQTPF